jgi:hypothetical protein
VPARRPKQQAAHVRPASREDTTQDEVKGVTDPSSGEVRSRVPGPAHRGEVSGGTAWRGYVFRGFPQGLEPGVHAVGDRLLQPPSLGKVLHEEASDHGGADPEQRCPALLR